MKKKKAISLSSIIIVIILLIILGFLIIPKVINRIRNIKHDTNVSSVESHIKKIEYELTNSNFELDNEIYERKESELNFTFDNNDTVRCEKYLIQNNYILKAYKCKKEAWNDYFYYVKGKKADTNAGLVE